MSNTILLKRSDISNSVPLSGNLVPGELALNFADGNLFFKDATSNIVLLTSTQFVNVTGNVTGSNLVTSGNVSGTNILGNGSQLTGINTFSTVSVATQDNVVADSIADTLTFVAGSGIAITTNAGADSITISATGSGLIFVDGADFGSVTEAVTLSDDLGLITAAVEAESDLGSIVTSGVFFPDLLVVANIDDFQLFGGTNGQYLGTSGNGILQWQTLDSAPLAGNMSGNINGNTFSIVNLASLAVNGNVTSGNLSVGTGTLTVGSVVNSNANGVGNIGSSATNFDTVFARATSAQYADLAEKYTADTDYDPGTVVIFGGNNEVTISNAVGDHRVAGVVSTNPAHVMNSGLTSQHVVTVALTGRVPTRVLGPVCKGDLMVSSTNGYAQACNQPLIGSIIGKSLENLLDSTGIIEIVVGVR